MRARQIQQLKTFSAAKEKQSMELAATAGDTMSPEAKLFFDAAKNGDGATVLAKFKDFKKRARQYEGSSNDKSLDTSYWQPMLDVVLGYETVVPMEPKSVQFFTDDAINSIPPGSIYFGGTDTGRGLITAFCKSHAEADPFFTLTQNALADNTYLEYLRRMYGAKINIPTADDSSKCFSDYLTDAQKRLTHDQDHPNEPKQLNPGEDIHTAADGKVSITGAVVVMEINGLLTRLIFERNPGKEFYVEESFPLDWMYPHLEPHGAIMKLNREKVAELSETAVANDQEYWRGRVDGMIGGWLTEDTPVSQVAAFAEKVYGRKDLSGFGGDKQFIRNDYAQKMYSKLRSAIAGVYDWRRKNSGSPEEKERMTRAADLAYRQAFALCPYSPEAVFHYMSFLLDAKRTDDALLLASASLKVDPNNQQLESWEKQLKQMQKR